MTFKDHFSENSKAYRQYRPEYPAELFSYLFSISSGNERAWDCATGTGQSAQGLAHYFSEVIATDASQSQINNAKRIRGITYLVSAAEKTEIEAQSIDVITVAQALHWFDIRLFFQEAERVLKPKGILAVWSYNLAKIKPDIDDVINHFYSAVLERYWPEERKMVESGYEEISFPFEKIEPPSFDMNLKWDLAEVLGYINTWSAVKKYSADSGINPVETLRKELAAIWGEPSVRLDVTWPLTLHVRLKNR